MNDNIIFRLFPEPIFKYKINNFENLNEKLSKYIYKLKEEDREGLKRSNKGGWHSKFFPLGIDGTIQNEFALITQKYIANVFHNYGWKTKDVPIRISEMWAIINKSDDFNVIHTHPNSYLSAAYYVRAPKNCGKFEVECPNIAKRNSHPEIEKQNDLNIEAVSIDINDGDLIIFPSYLPHKVAKNESGEDRIVISFNVDIKK